MQKICDEVSVDAWAKLFRAYKQLLSACEADLKRAGLPPLNWYDLLFEVYSAPNQRIRQYELGQRVLLPKYNVSRLVDRVEKEGLVARELCADDGRGAVIVITPDGKSMLKQMWQIYGAAIHRLFETPLDKREMSKLSEILQKVIVE